MLYQSLLVIVLGCAGLSRSAPSSIISPHQSTKTNEVVRAGFSSACRAPKSISRMVGGSEVVENEYPWLCSLKYKGFHICGITLVSGPPHQTILVGAAHCFSVGDTPQNYKVVLRIVNTKIDLIGRRPVGGFCSLPDD